ncbi:MAG TPA: 3-deoxy-D-manno-octulosonic acid transferase [Pirellulaceae bacterium]|jgi:3-deoxy-D-manno-octulosonic-acid transferase|nr:3-deoxy-D-manno-octulosonic acid transferase [Pirellulaceae bacterium]
MLLNAAYAAMLPIALNVAYAATLILALPWLLYARLAKKKYRDGYEAKFLGRLRRREGNRPCVWLHAVSVGEVNLLAGLIERVNRERPDCDVYVTVGTATGMEVAKKKYATCFVDYAPLDFSWAVRAAFDRIRPDALLLAELELWPNLILEADRRGTRLVLFNARVSEKSFRGYRRIRPLLASLLARFDRILVQNETYAERLLALGSPPERTIVAGSLKFDNARPEKHSRQIAEFRRLFAAPEGTPVFVAGSTQEPEERLAIETFLSLAESHADLRLILAPRHPERCDAIAALLERQAYKWVRRSTVKEPVAEGTRILLIDGVGELAAWWGLATVAFVGGSMGTRGGQNMLEPASYGAAVCFGPKTRNFRDVVEILLTSDAAQVVEDGEAMTCFVQRTLEDVSFRDTIGERAAETVRRHQGALERTWSIVPDLLPTDGTCIARRAA